MKAPDNDATLAAPLPSHRGAADYFNREQQSFTDRRGDWLWLSLFAVGGLASGLIGLRQVFVSRRQHAVDGWCAATPLPHLSPLGRGRIARTQYTISWPAWRGVPATRSTVPCLAAISLVASSCLK
jgi:hypothetical protein